MRKQDRREIINQQLIKIEDKQAVTHKHEYEHKQGVIEWKRK